MDSDKKLLSLTIRSPKHFWNRTILTTFVPEVADVEFYYRRLCGIEDATVSLHAESIPDEFNESLLSSLEKIPDTFPASDLETTHENEQRRIQYTKYIHQLCEMERSRITLNMYIQANKKGDSAFLGGNAAQSAFNTFVGSDSDPATSNSYRVGQNHLHRKRKWMMELLANLGCDDTIEEENSSASIVSSSDVTTNTLGWIVTPVVSSFRDSHGSRIILNPEIGKKWEHMLGTDLYPDIIITRRLNTSSWVFQHPLSDTLIRTTIDWYLATQDAKAEDGMTDWILDADREFSQLMTTFKRIKVNERLLLESLPIHGENRSKYYKLLTTIESQLLISLHEDSTISSCSAEIFNRFLTYLARAFNLPKETYQNSDLTSQFVGRWVRGKYGFRADSEPPVPSWAEIWKIVMRGRPNNERVTMFFRTLDCWDPLESQILSTAQKNIIVSDWINMFIDNELEAEEKSKIRSTILHDKVHDWCLKYVPASVFPTSFCPMNIGPELTRRGFICIKGTNGRFIHGLKYKNPEVAADATAATIAQIEARNAAAAAAAATTAAAAAAATTAADTVAEEIRTETVERTVEEVNEIKQTTPAPTTTKKSRTTKASISHTKAAVITQTITANNGSRIEHFFSTSVTAQEINLGSV